MYNSIPEWFIAFSVIMTTAQVIGGFVLIIFALMLRGTPLDEYIDHVPNHSELFQYDVPNESTSHREHTTRHDIETYSRPTIMPPPGPQVPRS